MATLEQLTSALVGVRIAYKGDMANPCGRGAIVAVRAACGVSFDIALDDGRHFPAVYPSSIAGMPDALGGPRPVFGRGGERFTAEPERIGAGGVAALHAAVAMRKAEASAKAEEAARAFAAAVERLKAEHPELTQGKDRKTAAANIRAMLRAAFPGVRFSITCGRGSGVYSIDIRWTDGPTEEAVSAIGDRFEHGHFDGMTDCYTYTRKPWTETFGSADYVHCTREMSEALIGRAIAAAVAEYGSKDTPTAADYRAGLADRVTPMDDDGSAYGHWSWQSIIYRTARGLSC